MRITSYGLHFVFQAALIVGGAWAFGCVSAPWFAYTALCAPAYCLGRARGI